MLYLNKELQALYPDLFTADQATKSDKFLFIFSEEDINYKLATFNDTFLSTLDAHAPIKSIRIRSRPCPYVTPEIKDQMTFRDQLFRRYRQSRNADAWKAYKEARTSVKNFFRMPSVTTSAQRADHTKITLDLCRK